MSKQIDPLIDPQPVSITPDDVPVWTGEILLVEKDANGTLTATLSWTDGVRTEGPPKPIENLANMAAVINTLEKFVASKNKEEARKEEIAALDLAAVVGPLDAVKDVLKPQTSQDDIDRKAFQDALTQYRLALAAEALGLPSLGSAKLLQTVQSTYKPEYITMLMGRF